MIQRLCRDVTERRRLEEENEFLREYYERILDMMPVGLGVKRNVDGTPKVAFENQKLTSVRFDVVDSKGLKVHLTVTA